MPVPCGKFQYRRQRPLTHVKVRFFCFRSKIILDNFGPKNQKMSIWYFEFNGNAHFFCFKVESPFSGKLSPKNLNCYFKLKFRTQTNWNMQNLMVMLIFSVLDQKHFFAVRLVKKNLECYFKLKFGTQTNSNMQNLMVMLTFSVLSWKYLFGANLV